MTELYHLIRLLFSFVYTADIRKTYDGPLALAVDYMVFNVTKGNIKVRMATIDEDIWPQPATQPKIPAELDKRIGFSKETISGRLPFADVVKDMLDEVNKKYGTEVPLPH